MVFIKLKNSKIQLYTALIIIVSCCVSLRSLTQIYFQFKKQTIEQAVFPVLYAARLEYGLEEGRNDQIVSMVEAIKDINAAELNIPVPKWKGPADYEEDWNELWGAHLDPIIYATSEFQIDPIHRSPQLAEQIQSVSGVTQVIWDQKRFQTYSANLDQWDKEQSYYSILFFLFMTAIIIGLVSSYPIRFRRDYVVRTGFGGAGSQVNPEGVWIQLIIFHISFSVICYSAVFTLGYLLFPFPTPTAEGPGFFSYITEGAVISGALATTVCLIGWWIKTKEINSVTAINPPTEGWRE